MNYNYHSHTSRCGHASGTAEEYILRAIETGIKYMGFSDHAPYICPNGKESNYRVPMEQTAEYFAELRSLREKYKDQIDLKIGFELEYYPGEFERILPGLIEMGTEYLILGEHFMEPELPNGIHTMRPSDSTEQLKRYVDCVCAAMRSGAFTYVAHPDLFNFTGDTATYRAEMTRLCEASKETDVPLEINFLGIRDGRDYPRALFWEIAGNVGCPVTYGFDAHDTLSAYDGASLETANEMVKTYGLNYIGMPRVIELQKEAV